MLAVSAAYFTPAGSRALKRTRTLHLMGPLYTLDKRAVAHGKALCGVEVSSMGFGHLSRAEVDERTCKRCKARA